MSIRFLSGINVDSNTLFVDDANNRVGIGTASPSYKLDVNVANNSDALRVQQAGASRFILNGDGVMTWGGGASNGYLSWDTNLAIVGGQTNNSLALYAGAGEKVRITTGGNVGIGTTSPSDKLTVSVGNVEGIRVQSSNSGFVEVGKTGGARWRWTNEYNSANIFELLVNDLSGSTPGQNVFTVNGVNGNIGIGTISPSQKLAIVGASDIVSYSNGTTTGYLYGDANGIGLFNGATGSGTGIYARTSNILDFYYGSSIGIRLSSTGNVGIGTTSPTGKLDVVPTSQNGINIARAGGYPSIYGSNDLVFETDSVFYFGVYTPRLFSVNGSFYTTVSGNVGIGTSNPNAKIHVVGTESRFGGVASGFISVYNATGRSGYIQANGGTDLRIASDSDPMTMYVNGSERMRISSAGALKLNAYGSGSNTGTATQRLAVDASGNVIEIPIGSGPVDGNGTANYVTKWSDTDTITNSIIYDNGTNVGIGTATPSSKLDVVGAIISTGTYQARMIGAAGGAYFGSMSAVPVIFQVNQNEVARFDASGQFSIATTTVQNPAAGRGNITIGGTSSSILNFGYNDSDNGYIFHNGDFNIVNRVSTKPLIFGTEGAERMRITSAGNVGVGTASPAYKLDVAGSTNVSTTNFYRYDGDTGIFGSGTSISGGTANQLGIRAANEILFATNGATEKMRLTTGGQLIVGGTAVGYSGTKLQVGNTSDAQNGLNILTSTTGYGYILFGDGAGADTYVGQIWYYHGDNYMGFQTNGGERMRITSAGNVGIGTTSPTLIGTGITTLDIQGSNAGGVAFGPSGFKNYIYGASTMYVEAHTTAVFATSGSEKMRITSAGNVGIGTTSPSEVLSVAGNIELTQGANRYIYIGSATNYYYRLQSVGDDFQIQEVTTPRLTIKYPNGNVGIGTTSPESKLHVAGGDVLISNGQYYGVESTTGGNYKIAGLTTGNVVVVGAIDYTSAGTIFAGGDNVNFTIGGVAGSTIIKISSSGNVGIGTTSPAGRLSVEGDGTEYSNIVFKQSAAQEHLIYASANSQYNLIGSGAPIWIWGQQGSTERMRLNNTGLGIGTDAPTQKLHVSGNVRVTGAYYDSNNEAGTSGQVLSSTGSGTDWVTPATTTASSLYDLLPAARTTYDWTVQMTSGTWADIFSSTTVLSSGTWMVQVYVSDFASGGQQYQETYSGVMSWGNSNNTNQGGASAISEVVLHRSGHAANAGQFYLRTQERASSTLLLQGMVNYSHTSNTTINFKFVKVF